MQYTTILNVSSQLTKDRQLVCHQTAGKQQSQDPVLGLPGCEPELIPVSHLHSSPVVLQWRSCLFSRGHSPISQWGKGGNANGNQGPRPGLVLSLLHGICQPHTKKNYLGQNLNSAAVEKSCSSIYQNLSYFNISECNSIIFLNSDLHSY